MRYPSRQSSSTRSSKQRPSLPAARERLAILIVVLFTGLCLVALVAQSTLLFERLLPYFATQLTLVLTYYFERRRRE